MKKVIFIGAGSIGKRHISNFVSQGIKDIFIVDPLPVREDEVRDILRAKSSEYSSSSLNIQFGTELPDSRTLTSFDLGVISTPPKWHLTYLTALANYNIAILCEKPLCKDTDNIEEVKKVIKDINNKRLLNITAYNYRFCSGLLRLKDIIDNNTLGKVVSFRGNFSENVREWHPWEGLDFYMSSQEQGGGALLDESHLLDICRWFFGEPLEVCSINGTHSSLKHETIFQTDDIVEVIAEFSDGIIGSIHMDLYGKHHTKSLEIVGEKGTAFWKFDNFDLQQNTVEVWKGERDLVSETNKPRVPDAIYPSDMEPRNRMYLDEAAFIIATMTTGKQARVDVPDLLDSLKTMEFIRAIRKSSKSKRFEKVGLVDLEN